MNFKSIDKRLSLRHQLLRVIHAIVLIVVAGLGTNISAQVTSPDTASIIVPDSADNDTNRIALVDTLATDTTESGIGSVLNSKVDYAARDSMILDVKQQKAYLYGDAIVNYESLELTAGYIEIDFTNSEVLAEGFPDSNGVIQGEPLFKEAGQEYSSHSMTYNFESKKGKIRDAFTQEGEGYIHGEAIKKETEDVFYIRNGLYTTCNLEHPHFHIKASKLKVINNKKIITGPAQMWIADVPTPLAIPFGFFPNKRGRQSGVIIPTYGNSPAQGFFLQNGGYYFGISDNLDASVVGDIYTNGSYSLQGGTNYIKRYKHNGQLQLSYSNMKRGDEETPDFTQEETFFVNWNHRQDPKARPNSNFQAQVQAGSNNNFRNNPDVNVNNFVQTNFSSNVSYTKNFANSPFSLTLNASHNQNNQDSVVNVTLPQATLTMSRVFPLKRKQATGPERWYEKIGMSLTSQFQNRLRNKDRDFFSQQTLDQARYGVQHSIPINTSIKVAKHFTFSPGMTWNDTWYWQTIRRRWEPATDTNSVDQVVTDTIPEFRRYGEASFNGALTTNLYGMYTFRKTRIKAIRHKITPSVSLNYTPNINAGNSAIFRSVQSDTNGTQTEYTVFDQGIYGAPTNYERAIISFDIQNNLEMKYRPRSDTAETLKKATLIEMFQVRGSYDMFIDSLNWSPVTVGIRTSIGRFLNVRTDWTLDPYTINSNGTRINTFRLDDNGDLFRVTRASAAIGLNLSSKERNGSNNQDQQDQQAQNNLPEPPPLASVADEELAYILANRDRYVDFNIPWTLNVNYTITYSKPGLTENIVNNLAFGGDMNITKNWKVGASSGYDFDQSELTVTSINVFRDLHCWQIVFSTVPFGDLTSYNIDIHVKASVLQDLKLTRRRSWFDLNQ